MKSNPIVSVIVPIYNAEEFLKECIDSILNQTFKDFEVLLINDGSTDNSGIICDKYTENDTRVRVFQKANGGVSSARNIGVINAKGTYSIHVDSDDYIEKDMIQRMYDSMMVNNTEIVIADYYYTSNGNKEYRTQNVTSDYVTCINDIFSGKLHAGLWNKMIKHSLYIDNNISFHEDIIYQEDTLIVISILLKAPKIRYLADAFYNHRHNSNSYTNNRSKKTFLSQFKVVDELENLLNDKKEFQTGLINLKLNIRRGIVLFDKENNFDVKKIYPETNKYIFKSETLTLLHKIYLWNYIHYISFINKVFIGFQKIYTQLK